MERSRIYCEIDFYKYFCENQPKVSILDEDDHWRNLFLFLLKKKSEIHLNITKSQFIIERDTFPFFEYLIENLYPENLLIFNSEDNEDFPNLNNIEKYVKDDKTFSQSFLMFNQPKEICEKIEDDYGIMVLHKENIKERCKFIFEPYLQPIEKNSKTIKDWSFLNDIKHPCNNLIIFDNYINKEKDYNLFALLSFFLPISLKTTFHITISTLKEDKGVKTNHKVLEEKTLKYIKEIRPMLNFKLCILAHDSSQVHDRDLLTNYIWLNIPAGFDLFTVNKRNEITTQHSTNVFGYFPTSFKVATLVSRNILIKSFSSVFNKAINTE